MTIITLPEHIEFILRRLAEDGHEAVVVGGGVRDAVLGRPVNDWDVATSATPIDVARIFTKTALTGVKFGTVTVILPESSVEVTTFRTEGEYQDGRHPESVEFVSSLDDDLSRRDFTMNAMAVPLGGELADPFGGIEDIKNRLVRCVRGPNTRFNEDALRMFRAFRFRAELGFKIEQETLQAIYANVDNAKQISAERVRVELEKTLMSQRPEIVGEMIQVGLLKEYLTESAKSPEGIDRIEDLPPELILRWCAFCAILLDNGQVTSAVKLLRDLHLDAKTVKACATALLITEVPDGSVGIKRLFAKHGVDAVRCAAAAHDVQKGGANPGGPPSSLARVDRVISDGECFSLNKLAISGSDLIALGYPPGRELGETLASLLDHVLEHPENNTREALMDAVQGR